METTERTYDQLIYADADLITMPATIAKGEVIKRGDLLVKDENGAFTKAIAPITEGIPAVAINDVNATDESQVTAVYVAGKFDGRSMHGGVQADIDAVVKTSVDYLLGYSIYILFR